VLLHVFRHVEARELVAEVSRELLGELGLADARRPGEQEAASRLVGLSETGAGALDRRGDGLDGFGLTEDHAVERVIEPLEPLLVRRRRLLLGDAGDAGDDLLDLVDVDGARRPFDRGRLRGVGCGADHFDVDAFRRRRHGRFRLQAQHGARFVQDVDRAVGQPRIAQVPRGELGGAVERAVGVQHVVVLLVT
jgi:hypothetical protein